MVLLPDGIKSADSEFSMTMEEFAEMVNDVRNAKLIAKGPDYELTEGEKESTIFRRSIFAVADIKKGEAFTEENVRIIRPGYGLKPNNMPRVCKSKASRDIKRGEPILEDCLEE